jgi:hypothetical protein
MCTGGKLVALRRSDIDPEYRRAFVRFFSVSVSVLVPLSRPTMQRAHRLERRPRGKPSQTHAGGMLLRQEPRAETSKRKSGKECGAASCRERVEVGPAFRDRSTAAVSVCFCLCVRQRRSPRERRLTLLDLVLHVLHGLCSTPSTRCPSRSTAEVESGMDVESLRIGGPASCLIFPEAASAGAGARARAPTDNVAIVPHHKPPSALRQGDDPAHRYPLPYSCPPIATPPIAGPHGLRRRTTLCSSGPRWPPRALRRWHGAPSSTGPALIAAHAASRVQIRRIL